MSDLAKFSDEITDDFRNEKKRIILLIDDSEVDRISYRRYLRTNLEDEYTFVEAETGEKALEVCTQSQPDIILLDYLLPDINGLDWLTQWQQQYQYSDRTSVIVLTGYGDENIAVDFIKLGAVDYLVKSQLTKEKLKLSVNRAIASQENKQALQEREALFRNTFELAAVGIAHVALDGTWLRVNQKLCQIVGYPKEELLKKTFQDITYPDDLESDLKYVRQILAGEITTYSIEKRYICQNKSTIWVNLTVSLVRDNYGQPDYFISIIENISDRKKLELSVKQSLQRLSNLYQLDAAILEARQVQEIAIIALDNIQKLLSSQRTSIVTFDWEQKKATILATQGMVAEGVGNGVQIPLSVWQDLIEQLENSDREYAICYLSQFSQLSQAISLFKDSKLNCFISFPLKTKNNLLGIFKIWIESIDAITSEQLEILREVSNQVAIALNQANLMQQLHNYALELETKVAQRTSQLEEINQELKTFTYSISHDLKAPLRAIQGFATALQEDYAEKLDDLGREYTWRLANSAQQMEKLIEDLLTYSRLSRTEIQLQKVTLLQVVIQAIEYLKPEIEQTQAQITICEPILDMYGNQTILRQIISNLLSNALKFVSRDFKPKVHIWTEKQDNYVRLWLEDNGIGIAPEHQKRIFRVFERLHGNEAYPGTGIGLAIVKKGTERLRGRLGVESQVNKGSRFWIELPYS